MCVCNSAGVICTDPLAGRPPRFLDHPIPYLLYMAGFFPQPSEAKRVGRFTRKLEGGGGELNWTCGVRKLCEAGSSCLFAVSAKGRAAGEGKGREGRRLLLSLAKRPFRLISEAGWERPLPSPLAICYTAAAKYQSSQKKMVCVCVGGGGVTY